MILEVFPFAPLNEFCRRPFGLALKKVQRRLAQQGHGLPRLKAPQKVKAAPWFSSFEKKKLDFSKGKSCAMLNYKVDVQS